MTARELYYYHDKVFTTAEDKAYAREELVYNVTEDILVVMEEMKVPKTELARRLGKSRSYITQILSGVRNMTLGSLSDICFVLGVKPCLQITQNKQVPSYTTVGWTKESANSNDFGYEVRSLRKLAKENKEVWMSDEDRVA